MKQYKKWGAKYKGTCQECGKRIKLDNSGHLRSHGHSVGEVWYNACPGSYEKAAELDISYAEESLKSAKEMFNLYDCLRNRLNSLVKENNIELNDAMFQHYPVLMNQMIAWFENDVNSIDYPKELAKVYEDEGYYSKATLDRTITHYINKAKKIDWKDNIFADVYREIKAQWLYFHVRWETMEDRIEFHKQNKNYLILVDSITEQREHVISHTPLY